MDENQSTIRGTLKKDGYSQEDKFVYEREKALREKKQSQAPLTKSENVCPCCGTPMEGTAKETEEE